MHSATDLQARCLDSDDNHIRQLCRHSKYICCTDQGSPAIYMWASAYAQSGCSASCYTATTRALLSTIAISSRPLSQWLWCMSMSLQCTCDSIHSCTSDMALTWSSVVSLASNVGNWVQMHSRRLSLCCIAYLVCNGKGLWALYWHACLSLWFPAYTPNVCELSHNIMWIRWHCLSHRIQAAYTWLVGLQFTCPEASQALWQIVVAPERQMWEAAEHRQV